MAHDGVRGEVTVVVAGAETPSTAEADALELVRQAVAGGAKLSAAVGDVAKLTGANRKELYAAALADKEQR